MASINDMLAQAAAQYPIIKGANAAQVITPATQGDDRLLEFWPPGEEGDNSNPRPKGLPLDRPGIQVLQPSKVKPSDVAADIVSHYLVHSDPKLSAEYHRFVQSFETPRAQDRLHKDYQWAQKNEGEERPFQEWAMTTRIPAYFRGYVFKQWPSSIYQQMYSPDQIKMLQGISSYLSGPRSPSTGINGTILSPPQSTGIQ